MTARKGNARRQPGAAEKRGSRAANGNGAAAQRARLLKALRRGPVTTPGGQQHVVARYVLVREARP